MTITHAHRSVLFIIHTVQKIVDFKSVSAVNIARNKTSMGYRMILQFIHTVYHRFDELTDFALLPHFFIEDGFLYVI
jgi:hypothetical protein